MGGWKFIFHIKLPRKTHAEACTYTQMTYLSPKWLVIIVKPKKTVRASRLTLDPRVFIKSKGETKDTFLRSILTELKTFNFFGRKDLIRMLAEHPRLPQDFTPLYGEGRVFHGVVNLGSWISEENYIDWLFGIFHRHRNHLRTFLQLRTKISAQVLKGDAIGALKTIDEVSKISESWWSIESSIHINRELLGNDTKGYIKHLHETYSHMKFSRITRDLLLLSESNSAVVYIENILGRINEYKNSAVEGATQHGAVESCQLLPIYYDSGRRPSLERLFDYRTWSIFDQYDIFRSIIMEMAAGHGTGKEWQDGVMELAASVGDWELINALSIDNVPDEFVSGIIEKYTRGDYEMVLRDISKAVADESPRSFGLIEIYARSKIYMSSVGQGQTFYDKLSDEFARILVLDSKSTERAEYLRKISVKFRREAWAKSLLYHLISVKEWRSNDDSIEILRQQTLCLGSYNTPKARDGQFHLEDIPFVERSSIPKHRIMRYAAGGDTELVVDASEFPIYSDYLKKQSRNFVEKQLISQALEFCISEYLKNPVSFDHLPIPQLCGFIEGLERGADFDYISCLIMLDIFCRECDSSFDEQKSDLFEEFLCSCHTHQPSRIFDPANIDPKVTYFLRHLCVPAQLDNVIEFSSNDEVIHERVAIIDLLISARAGNTEGLRAEKDKVLETLFSEKLRAKIETGKLYVDVQALETHRRHIYIALYEQAKSIEGGVNLEPLSEKDGNIDSSDLFKINDASAVAVVSSEKSGILLKIFLQAIHDFALNENYGLDKYLSAEVRHIVFVTQLRACFEKNELVTIQKNGEYLSNLFWVQKYNYVSSSIVDELDSCLRRFSRDVDTILTKVNDRFRVKVADLDSDHIFDFSPYHGRLVRVSEIVSSSDNFESFFSGLIGFMWELAIESARSAQQLINDVLLVDILWAIDALEEEVQSLKGNIAMVDLMQAIRNARSDFKKEIELVLNWFRFVGAEDLQTFERLGVVVEAAVSSFQSMFKHKGKDLEFSQERSDMLLSYSEARSLFISLFTALENALRYGAVGTPVMIFHNVRARNDQLLISNEIGVEINDPSNFVAETKAKWNGEYSKLSTAEGGSGLYKIYNLLTNASQGFSLDISIEGKRFNVHMDLHHEYFDYRG